MTQVDFYIVNEPGELPHLTTSCRVIEKAWARQHEVYVHTASQAMMQQLDDLLWTFRPNSFVPHRCETTQAQEAASLESKTSENTQAPDIVIACSGHPGQHHDVLINLTDTTPEFFGRFKRVAEIVPGDEAAKTKSRERYKYYRKRGYPLNVHQL